MGFTMTTAEVIRFLRDHGFIQKSGGRHQIKMTKDGLSIPVPDHSGIIPKGTVQAILRKAGFTAEDVMEWRG